MYKDFEDYLLKLEDERLDFLISSVGFSVRPVDYKDFYVFSSEHKFERRMEKVKEKYPMAAYKKLPSHQSCQGDYFIRLEPKDINYKDIKYYLYNIKHLIKIFGYWNIFTYIVCWEWDCYPQDVENDFLYEGFKTVGIDTYQSL